MNHTHYVLIDNDKQVVCVLKEKDFKGRLIKAVEDETGDKVTSISFNEIGYENYKIVADLAEGSIYEGEVLPTWEY